MTESDKLRILYVGPVIAPSRRFHTVCRMRAEGLKTLGHDVTLINAETPTGFWRFQIYRVGNRLDRPPDVLGTNRAILREIRRRHYDVLWIDKGRSTRPGTLAAVRRISPKTLLLTYSPDDMMNPANQSVQLSGDRYRSTTCTSRRNRTTSQELAGSGCNRTCCSSTTPTIPRFPLPAGARFR